MKLVIHFLMIAVLGLLLLSCAVQKTEEQIQMEELADEILNSGKPVYMAHNLWYEDPDKIEAINFLGFMDRIEVGSEMDYVVLAYHRFDIESSHIRFKVKGDDNIYRLFLGVRYHGNRQKGLTHKELLVRTFTTKPLIETTAGLKPEEKENVVNGTIQKGMSKKAVLMSWGYPPLHHTVSLDEKRWVYLRMRTVSEYIVFDEKDQVLKSTWYGVGGNPSDVIE